VGRFVKWVGESRPGRSRGGFRFGWPEAFLHPTRIEVVVVSPREDGSCHAIEVVHATRSGCQDEKLSVRNSFSASTYRRFSRSRIPGGIEQVRQLGDHGGYRTVGQFVGESPLKRVHRDGGTVANLINYPGPQLSPRAHAEIA
jgi:hypothetical protein